MTETMLMRMTDGLILLRQVASAWVYSENSTSTPSDLATAQGLEELLHAAGLLLGLL